MIGALLNGTILDSCEDIISIGAPEHTLTSIATLLKHLARGNRVGAFDIAGGLHRYDRPMLRRGGVSEGGLITRPLNLFMPKMPGLSAGMAEAAGALERSYDTAQVVGADANSIAEVVLALVEPDVGARRALLRRLRTGQMHRDVSTTNNTNVCLAQLANEIHTVLEVDLGVKIAVAIVPSKIGATRRVHVVHTARGWVQAAPRGSAMYGAFDGAGASRRPLDAVMILDTQPVSGGFTPSGAVVCQRADRIPRAVYRHACRGRTLGGPALEGARSVAGPDSLHCLEFLCRTWTGRSACAPYSSWECELSAWACKYKPYTATGDNRLLHEVLSAAYGVSFEHDGSVRFATTDYRTVLVLLCNLEAAIVEVVQDYTDGSSGIGDDVLAAEGIKQYKTRNINMATARGRRDLDRARSILEMNPNVDLTTSRIHPLRSLSGLRATATGSYAVAVRVTRGHIEPLLMGDGYKALP